MTCPTPTSASPAARLLRWAGAILARVRIDRRRASCGPATTTPQRPSDGAMMLSRVEVLAAEYQRNLRLWPRSKRTARALAELRAARHQILRKPPCNKTFSGDV